MTGIKGAQPKPGRLFGGLAVRSNRKEYWLWIAAVVALSVILGLVFPEGDGSVGIIGVILVAQIRRLHDFGRSGWWALGAQVLWIVVMLLVGSMSSRDIGVMVGGLLSLALIVLIGAIPGDAEENRFGKPQSRLFATA